MTSKRHHFGVGVLNSYNFHSIRSTIVVATTRVYHKGLQLLLQHLKLIASPIESSRNRLLNMDIRVSMFETSDYVGSGVVLCHAQSSVYSSLYIEVFHSSF